MSNLPEKKEEQDSSPPQKQSPQEEREEKKASSNKNNAPPAPPVAAPPKKPPPPENNPLEYFTTHPDLVVQELTTVMERCLVLMDRTAVADYRLALRVVPHLVARESPATAFLRAEQYHPTRAAQRLARYWTVRKELFGQTRWLKPLTMTQPNNNASQESSALPSQAIELLQTGFQMVLTNEQHAVMIWDLRRLPAGVDHFQPAVIFYLLSTAAAMPNNTSLQSPGLTIVHVVQDGYRPFIFPQATALRRLSQALPISICRIVVAQSMAAPEGTEHLVEYRAFEQERVCDHNTKVIPQEQRAPVTCLSAKQVRELLSPDVLPAETLGGSFSYATDWPAWLRMRQKLEEYYQNTNTQQQHESATKQSTATTTMMTTSALTSTSLPELAPSSASLVSLSSGEQQQQQGTTAVYASNTSITANSAVNDDDDDDLLVRQAPGESQADFTRRRNSVYAKRFQQKQKWSRVALQVQVDTARATQVELKAEHARLQRLLNQAQAIVQVELIQQEYCNNNNRAARTT